MQRIDDPSAATSLPTPEAAGAPGYWTEGNPVTGVPATLERASWFNSVQEELMSILAAAGVAPSKTTYTQVVQAIQTLTRQVLGNRQSMLAKSGAYTILPTDMGKIIYVAGAGGAILTLPPANSVPVGAAISVINLNTGGVTIGRPASGLGSSDVIQYGIATTPSSAIFQGEFLELVSDGSSQWIPGARTTGLDLLPSFAAARVSNGYQKLPGGLILQWGFANAGTDSNGATISFPIAFPTGVLSVVATNNEGNCAAGGAQVISPSQFKLFGRLYSGIYSSYGFYWQAIGY